MDLRAPEDYGRAVNLVLALIALVWLIIRRFRHNNWYAKNVSTIRNDVWLLALFWSAGLVVGSFEQLFNTGTNVRVVLASAAILVTLKMLIRPARDWKDLNKL